jgi:hypothetical protein
MEPILICEENSFTATNFYLLKYNYECQWYGVFQDWVAKPFNYDKARNEILESFSTNNNFSNIVAVIKGNSGNGKSTFLRKLAADFIECEFETLWITNLYIFNLHINKLKYSESQLYLLIIEDWYEITEGSNSVPSFLSDVTKLKNVRIVIADKDRTNQPYFEYFHRDKATHVSSFTMMRQVLQKAAEVNRQWEPFIDVDFPESMFYLRNISVALFIVHTTHVKKVKPDELQLGGIENQFLNTLRSELLLINDAYPGLGIAIIYWAHICREFGKWTVLITWNILFKIADLFNENQKTRTPPKAYDDKIYPLLMYYLRLESLVYPQDRNEHLVYFNHDLIIDEGFTKILLANMRRYDKDIISEIIKYLSNSDVSSNEVGVAFMIAEAYYQIYKEEDIFGDDNISRNIRRHYARRLHYRWFFTNALISNLYNAILEGVTSPLFWQKTLNNLSIEYFKLRIGRRHLLVVLKQLIKKGCLDHHILRAHRISSKGWFAFRYCMSDAFYENSVDIDINQYYATMVIEPWRRRVIVGRWITKLGKLLKRFLRYGNPMTKNENTNSQD